MTQIMVQIIMIVTAIFLLGSTIYSTQFHLRNYFRSKKSDSTLSGDLEGAGQSAVVYKTARIVEIVVFQVIKTSVAIALICYLILGYSSGK
jgi:hypothetical protein